MLIFIYAVLIFLVIRFSVTLFNFLSNPKLGHYGKHFQDKISIIILASSDHEDFNELLISIQNQDYADLEIIVKKPSESLTESVDSAKGKYLLFLEPGMIVHKGFINNLIYRMKVFNLDMLKIMPNRKPKYFIDYIIYPAKDFVLLNIFPFRLARMAEYPIFSTGVTGCIFFDASVYKQHAEPVQYKDGATKSELIKRKIKTEILLANKFVYDINRNNRAFGKDLTKIFGNNILIALIYLIFLVAGPVVMLINFDAGFWALPIGLIFLSRIMTSFLTAQNPLINVLLHPIQMMVIAIGLLKHCRKSLLTLLKQKNL